MTVQSGRFSGMISTLLPVRVVAIVSLGPKAVDAQPEMNPKHPIRNERITFRILNLLGCRKIPQQFAFKSNGGTTKKDVF